jgi:ABC-type glycerol-3-phosphate transport system substrate-binding protein
MKKVISVILALSLGLTSVFAGGASEQKADSTKDVELVILHHMGEQSKKDGLAALADSYSKLNPNVSFDIQFVSMDDIITSIKQSNMSQDIPAIINIRQAQVASDLMGTGVFEPIPDSYYPEAMSKEAISALAFDGVNYGIPLDIGGQGLYYNETILKENGIDPSSVDTIDGLLAACEILKNNGVTPFASGYAETWIETILVVDSFMQSGLTAEYPGVIQELMDGTIRFADIPELPAAFDARMKIINDYALVNDKARSQGGSDQYAQFGRGESAFMMQGTWAVGDIRKAQKASGNTDTFHFTVMPWSNDESLNLAVSQVDDSFNVGAATDNKEVAMDFAKYCATPEASKIWVSTSGTISPIAGVVADDEDPLIDEIRKTVTGERAWFFEAVPVLSGQFYQDFNAAFTDARVNGLSGAQLVKNLDVAFDNVRTTGN